MVRVMTSAGVGLGRLPTPDMLFAVDREFTGDALTAAFGCPYDPIMRLPHVSLLVRNCAGDSGR
jgi:hypothetical protein